MLRRKGCFLLSKRFSFYYRKVGFQPHPQKTETGGEDAFLSTSQMQAVLDGVSWWRDSAGVDAGLYSAAVARSMYDYVEEDLLGDIPASSLRLLDQGYIRCKHGETLGTCTAVVATLQPPQLEIQTTDEYKIVVPDGSQDESASSEAPGEEEELSWVLPGTHTAETTNDLNKAFSSIKRTDGVENFLLDVAYVGDCGVMVIRRGRVIFVSEEQAHDLDYPFQLGTGSKDTPQDAIRLLIPVEKGDIVALGSDGIFDNVYPHRIAELLWGPVFQCFLQNRYIDLPGTSVGQAEEAHSAFAKSHNLRSMLVQGIMEALDKGCAAVMHESTAVSRDIHCDSPYASKCIENGAMFEGGKPDDMTLLVSVIGVCDEDNAGERFSTDETTFPPPYRDWP